MLTKFNSASYRDVKNFIGCFFDADCKKKFIVEFEQYNRFSSYRSHSLFPYSFRKNSTTPFELKLLDKFTSYFFFFVVITMRTVHGGIEPKFSAKSFNLLKGFCLSRDMYNKTGLAETNCLYSNKESLR